MARTPLPYKLKNRISDHVRLEQAKRVSEQGGKRVTIKQVEQDLANYCSIAYDTIKSVKRGHTQPSAPLALKMAQFFGVPFEDLWGFSDGEESTTDDEDEDMAG